jgi:hypothetical protein
MQYLPALITPSDTYHLPARPHRARKQLYTGWLYRCGGGAGAKERGLAIAEAVDLHEGGEKTRDSLAR